MKPLLHFMMHYKDLNIPLNSILLHSKSFLLPNIYGNTR